MAISNRARPISANSKKEKPDRPFCVSVLLTMILGGVPVQVNKPPVFEPNATGINSLEGSVPAFQAAETVTGNRAATVPVHPVLVRPSPTMNRAAIITTVGLLKPLRVSVIFNMPVKYRASIDIKATASGGYLPQSNSAMVMAKMTASSIMWLRDPG